MADETALGAAVRLTIEMEAAAALAAYVRVTTESLDVDPTVRALLDAIAAEIATDAADIGPAGQSIVGMVRAFLRQATDLVDNPGRIGDWDHVDEAVLQGVGRLSMAITNAFRAATDSLEGLGERLGSPGSTFLDVGTGTAWLAIAIARTFPAVHVTGIDIFEPALRLARKNVVDEGMQQRIDLRMQDAIDLDLEAAYDAIWLPLPFMPRAIVPRAIAASARALRPGGWLLPGTFGGPGDRLSQLLVDLRTVRSGGHPWQAAELIELLTAHDLVDPHEVPRTWTAPVRLFAARRTGRSRVSAARPGGREALHWAQMRSQYRRNSQSVTVWLAASHSPLAIVRMWWCTSSPKHSLAIDEPSHKAMASGRFHGIRPMPVAS